MENNERKGNGLLIAIIIVLVLGLIGLGSYIVYDKVIDKDEPKTENKVKEENKKQDIKDKDKQELTGNSISKITQTLLDNQKDDNYTYMNGTYLKGKQENNYVWYNGFLWIIMGKNSDGTIRLMTKENVAAISYGSNNQGLLYATNTGYINDWLNNYFFKNLDSIKSDIIVESEWCINPTEDSASSRTDCTNGSTFKAKVGLITLDEHNLSDSLASNGLRYWTLTPTNESTAWGVSKLYDMGHIYVILSEGIRPVINVNASSIVTSGTGAMDNAYILNQTTNDKTGKLNEKTSSGEYVSLNDKMYRVVSKDTDGTKLIYDGYYSKKSVSELDKLLNEEVLNWLGNSDKIVSTTWYQGEAFVEGSTYTSSLKETNPLTGKVGLIRIGEMLSGQSISIYKKDETICKTYKALNKTSKNEPTCIFYTSGAFVCGTFINTIRPVIVVDNNTTINSGNGTVQNPYILK